jgi:queuine tRNA-ribosyltransferase
LRHLLRLGEPTASRLVTLHNLHWTLDLVRRVRVAIEGKTLTRLRAEVAAVWEG